MVLGCGMKCIKTLMFVFNFIFWILGIAVLAVGIWTRVELGAASWKELMEQSTIPNAANLMIAAGILVAIIGFFGCCGAIKENQCMLVSYTILIVLIFILEIASGICAYTKKDDVRKGIEKKLNTTVANSYGRKEKGNVALTKAVDWFQKNMKCCGAKEPGDWSKSKWFTSRNTTKPTAPYVPGSCCVKEGDCKTQKITQLITKSKIWKRGCVSATESFVKEKTNIYVLGGTGVGIALIQLLGIAFALCLCQAIKKEKNGSQA